MDKTNLTQVGRALAQLGIWHNDGVGPAGAALIRAFAVVRDEDWLREQVRIIGEATRAAQELAVAAKEAQSYQAAPRTTDLGAGAMVRLAVRGVFAGNGPDLVEDEFIVDVLEIYRKIIGREPTVTNSPTNGTVSGTCLRFVQEAGRVIGVEVTGNRLHRIVNTKRKKAI